MSRGAGLSFGSRVRLGRQDRDEQGRPRRDWWAAASWQAMAGVETGCRRWDKAMRRQKRNQRAASSHAEQNNALEKVSKS
jgi:hypothetical protein